MGNRIWLYLHILDRADWETGIVYDWRDEHEAEDMAANWRTIQKQRQELEEMDYIVCSQVGGRGQQITVLNWSNPKSYGGEIINPRAGYENMGTQGTPEGTPRPYRERRTPSSYSNINNQRSNERSETDATILAPYEGYHA